MKSAFLTPLVVQELSDSTWQVVANLEYYSELLEHKLVVPAGFVTDFASVPRIPFIFDVLGDIAHEPATLHDWLYYTACQPRSVADKLLFEAMGVQKPPIPNWKRWQIYAGVRLGGWKAWGDHRKAGDPLTK